MRYLKLQSKIGLGHSLPKRLTMACYWVFGGEYLSTDFTAMAEGREEERYGPFESYAAAKEEWARLSAARVGNGHLRYFIRRQKEGAPRYLSA